MIIGHVGQAQKKNELPCLKFNTGYPRDAALHADLLIVQIWRKRGEERLANGGGRPLNLTDRFDQTTCPVITGHVL